MHPGTAFDERGLTEALQQHDAVITWGSGAAIKAMLAGVTVVYDYSSWIARACAVPLHRYLTDPSDLPEIDSLACRLDTAARLATHTWSIDEIANGSALAWFLS
jgi:hypothetical protein